MQVVSIRFKERGWRCLDFKIKECAWEETGRDQGLFIVDVHGPGVVIQSPFVLGVRVRVRVEFRELCVLCVLWVL